MDQREEWFDALRSRLEASYLSASDPWAQSGFSGPEERWVACRRPIADCLDRGGSFLDIGCANGYLLDCIVRWAGERGLRVDPFGLDLSAALVNLARERYPGLAARLFVGNALTWTPPRRFDFVRTELCYVPPDCVGTYVGRLLRQFLSPGGRLLVCHYRSRREPPGPWDDERLRALGFPVERVRSGSHGGLESTRVAVVRAAGSDLVPSG